MYQPQAALWLPGTTLVFSVGLRKKTSTAQVSRRFLLGSDPPKHKPYLFGGAREKQNNGPQRFVSEVFWGRVFWKAVILWYYTEKPKNFGPMLGVKFYRIALGSVKGTLAVKKYEMFPVYIYLYIYMLMWCCVNHICSYVPLVAIATYSNLTLQMSSS